MAKNMAVEIRNKSLSGFRRIHSWSEFNQDSGSDFPGKKLNMSIKENQYGIVTLLLGWEKDMAIVFKDPVYPRMIPAERVSNDEVAATRALFDTEVTLAIGGLKAEDRDVIRQRRLRLSMMLADLGRPDIVGAMRRVGDYLRTDTRNITTN